MVWGWMDLAMFMLALPQMPLLAAAANAPFRRKGAGSGRSSSISRMKGGHRPTSLAPGGRALEPYAYAAHACWSCRNGLQKYWPAVAACSS
ncbi:hypothetical protein V8C43DRAFT_311474 [Trichoderma afarasin]